jgi:hypothetical protein
VALSSLWRSRLMVGQSPGSLGLPLYRVKITAAGTWGVAGTWATVDKLRKNARTPATAPLIPASHRARNRLHHRDLRRVGGGLSSRRLRLSYRWRSCPRSPRHTGRAAETPTIVRPEPLSLPERAHRAVLAGVPMPRRANPLLGHSARPGACADSGPCGGSPAECAPQPARFGGQIVIERDQQLVQTGLAQRGAPGQTCERRTSGMS